MLIVIELFVRNLAALFHRVELADLLEREQLVDRAGGVVDDVLRLDWTSFHHAARHDDRAHFLEAADAHQHRRNGFVAAGDEHAAVVDRGVGLRLDQIDDRVTVCQRVIDAVVALRNAVAHIGGKVACGLAAMLVDRAGGLCDKPVEVRRAGMAVAEGAFDQDLRLTQIADGPAHADLERIVLRCKRPDGLTS